MNEEEFPLRNGFRWSPDGRRIACWQVDASGGRDLLLGNDTDSLDSGTRPIPYSRAGTTDASALGFAIAILVPTARFAPPVGALILYPMIGISGLLVPVAAYPPVRAVVARVLPPGVTRDLSS